MKTLVPILFLFILLNSCYDVNPIPTLCWECKSIINKRDVSTTVCYENITDIEDYKTRMLEFYGSQCTSVECKMIEKGDTTNIK